MARLPLGQTLWLVEEVECETCSEIPEDCGESVGGGREGGRGREREREGERGRERKRNGDRWREGMRED